MIRDLLLALGLVLSPASQLRLPGVPLGPGEVCFVLWVLSGLLSEATRVGPPFTPVFTRLFLYWVAFGSSLVIGTLMAMVIGDLHDPGLFMHDALAYPLLAAISLLLVVEPGSGLRLRRIAWFVVTIGAVVLALQAVHGLGLLQFGELDPWYWDRLRGWSANPNQLGLLCAVFVPTALHLAETAAGPWSRLVAIMCLVIGAIVGRMTKSDTFSLFMIAGALLYCGLKLRSALRMDAPRLAVKSTLAWVIVFALPFLITTGAAVGYLEARQLDTLVRSLSKDNGEGTQREASLRFDVWRQAIGRGVESHFLGLGPGPHIDIPSSIITGRQAGGKRPKYIDHPDVNGLPNFEAHNTILDLFTQGGLLAVVSLVWLIGSTTTSVMRARSDALTVMLFGLVIFGIFHLIIRSPLFWFAIGLCLIVASKSDSRLNSLAGSK
jgi:O-Antigen ligase